MFVLPFVRYYQTKQQRVSFHLKKKVVLFDYSGNFFTGFFSKPGKKIYHR